MGKRYPVPGLDRHGRKWRLRRTVDGRQVTHTFEAQDEQEAVETAWRLWRRMDLDQGRSWELDLEAYLEEGRESGRLSLATAENRRYRLARLGEELGIGQPRELTPAVLRGWYQRECERVKVETVNRYLRDVGQFLGWLVRKRRLVANAAEEVEPRRVQAARREVFLQAGEVARLLEAARRRGDAELELIVLLACECGMRRGEIAAARPEWFDLERGVVTVPPEDERWKRKGSEGRRRAAVVPLSRAVQGWFARHGVPSPFLLQPAKPWRAHRYRYDFKRKLGSFLKAEGFAGVTIHDLRRSFGSNRVSAGASIEKVANWMGIRVDAAWKHYARFVASDADIELGTVPAGEEATRAAGETRADGAGEIEERLERLARLLEKGLISSEEAAARRAEILGEV